MKLFQTISGAALLSLALQSSAAVVKPYLGDHAVQPSIRRDARTSSGVSAKFKERDDLPLLTPLKSRNPAKSWLSIRKAGDDYALKTKEQFAWGHSKGQFPANSLWLLDTQVQQTLRSPAQFLWVR